MLKRLNSILAMSNKSEYHKERDSLRQAFNDKVASTRELMEKLYSDDSNGFVKIDNFSNLDIGKKYEVSDGVYFIPLDYNDEYMEFHTSIKGGYFYGVQWHDKMEICKVSKGEMVDKISGKTCKVGEKMVFKAFEKHKPGAYVDTESNVKFYL